MNAGVSGMLCGGEEKGRTFAMDPQERRRLLPLFEDTPLEEPRRSSLVVGLARNILIF